MHTTIYGLLRDWA